MAPKMKKGKGKETYDATKFVSLKAETHYNELIANKKLIPEKFFQRPGGRVEGTIVERNWEQFCYFSAFAVISIVKEFYANLIGIGEGGVFVRERLVPFAPSAISRILGTEIGSHCSYSDFSVGSKEEKLDEVINFLTDGNGRWKMRGASKVNFLSNSFNTVSKAWHYFISASMLPTNHLSEVTKERAILNYCIQKGSPINVARIIYGSITSASKSLTGAGLGHPALIFTLCYNAGVQFAQWEEQMPPLRPITKQSVGKYSPFRKSKEKKAEGASTSGASTSQGPQSEYQADLRELQQRLGRIDLKMDHLDSYLYDHNDFEYNAFDQLFRAVRGDESAQMPPRHTYQRFVYPQEEAEGDDDDDDDDDGDGDDEEEEVNWDEVE